MQKKSKNDGFYTTGNELHAAVAETGKQQQREQKKNSDQLTSLQASRRQDAEIRQRDMTYLLGDVPDVPGGVETHQLVTDSNLVKRRSLLVTKERVRNPDVLQIVLA